MATHGAVNLSGKKTVDFALMLNGQIPAPTLEFTEGDDAEIVVKNRIPAQEVSVHWHGILLPNGMDGVSYVTTPPIHSGHAMSMGGVVGTLTVDDLMAQEETAFAKDAQVHDLKLVLG